MLDKFIEYLKYERNFSKHTVLAYQTDLDQYHSYLKDTYDLAKPEEAASPMIRSWLASLLQDKTSARTVVRKA
ncbi:MAG: site-specific integrase, partial [Bacteroidia bacterium]|nr:site-specific integrase [Bacteroidia bacterium]